VSGDPSLWDWAREDSGALDARALRVMIGSLDHFDPPVDEDLVVAGNRYAPGFEGLTLWLQTALTKP